MQTPVAQCVALTIYGNVFLSIASPLVSGAFFPSNSTFRFCKEVKFFNLEPQADGWKETLFADDPIAWLGRLKRDGFFALRLKGVSSADEVEREGSYRRTVGLVGGGGRWLIEAIGRDGSDFWEGKWSVGNRDDPDQKIWRVSYGRVASRIETEPFEKPDFAEIRDFLHDTLERIEAFAERNDLSPFTSYFAAGLARLTASEPLDGTYHSDIAPAGALSLQARRLLGAALSAWAFGGMGSWNDLGFEGEDQATYEEVSNDLFNGLVSAVIVAANSGIRMPG